MAPERPTAAESPWSHLLIEKHECERHPIAIIPGEAVVCTRGCLSSGRRGDGGDVFREYQGEQ